MDVATRDLCGPLVLLSGGGLEGVGEMVRGRLGEGILVGGQGDAGRAGRVRIVWVRRREEERRDDEWLWDCEGAELGRCESVEWMMVLNSHVQVQPKPLPREDILLS